MKKYIALTVGALLIVVTIGLMSGCSSTLTLGPQANEDAIVGANLSTEKVAVTLPLIKAETGTAKTQEE